MNHKKKIKIEIPERKNKPRTVVNSFENKNNKNKDQEIIFKNKHREAEEEKVWRWDD